MSRFWTRLRIRLTLTAAIAVLPALAVMSYDHLAHRRGVRDRVVDTNLRLTNLAASQQAAVFTNAQRFLQTLAQFPSLRASDPRECDQLLAALMRDHPNFVALVVVNVDGSVFCSSSPTHLSTSYGDRPWFHRVMQARKTVLGEYQIGRMLGAPNIVVAHPLLGATGEVEHVLVVGLDLNQLEREVSAARVPEGGTLTLFDRTRTVLARYPDGARWVGRQVPETIPVQRLTGGASQAVDEIVGIDGVRRLYATVPIEAGFDTGLYVSVGLEHAAAFAGADRVLFGQILLLGLLSIAVFGAALVGGQALIIRPINALKAVTARLAAGDLSARVSLNRDVPGFSDLGQSIDSMAVALEGRQRERDQAEGERRLLASIVEDSDDAILSMTPDGAILSWNAGAERLYGYSAAEAIGQSMSLIVAADRASEVLELLARTQRGDAVKHYETVRQLGDGSQVPVSLTLSPIRDATARIVGASAIVRDVTERVRVEQALQVAEERMRFALEASHVGIWEGDVRGGDLYWSETHEVMHGLAPHTFKRTVQAFIQCIHPEDRDHVREIIHQAGRNRVDAELEYRTVWPDGSEHWIGATAHFLYDTAGIPVRGAGVAIDITERRSLEDQLRQAQKMEAVGRLAGGIAHDFNNMLTAILGNAEFALDDLPAGGTCREDVEEIIKAGRRAATLTHQLLAFSRKQILTLRVLHLGDVVGEVTPMLRRLLGETIDLKATVTDRGRIKADAGQIQQVLVNLAVNARDAMPDGGSLTIETADVVVDDAHARRHPLLQPGPYVMVTVTDTGCGMDAATQQRVFEPFFTTKPKGQGTGLGLATVYGIVQQSGGHVWVQSEPGRGATFKVYLPRTDDVEEAPQVAAVDPRTLRGSEAILLVEDEQGVREFVHKVLTQHGYAVRAAAEPRQAIAMAGANGTVDLVLTDVILPDLSGRAMVAEMQRSHGDLKVLYMSGYTDNAIVHHGVLDPGMWFLPKPFTAVALLKRVRDVLDARLS